MPGYVALKAPLSLLDPAAYAGSLSVWLQANAGLLPRSLALDGNSIGNGRCDMIITLSRHEDGRPVAMIPATGKKSDDCEVSEGRTLWADEQVARAGAIITADPSHNKQATPRIIAG